MHSSCAALVQSVRPLVRPCKSEDPGFESRGQTKILKKSLVIRVNSKSASRTGIYLKRTRVKVQLVDSQTKTTTSRDGPSLLNERSSN